MIYLTAFNPLNAELNPICPLLALLGAQHILHISGLRVNSSARLQLRDKVVVFTCSASESYFNTGKKE